MPMLSGAGTLHIRFPYIRSEPRGEADAQTVSFWVQTFYARRIYVLGTRNRKWQAVALFVVLVRLCPFLLP